MKKALFLLMGALLIAMTGCDLKFGDDVELSGAAFDAQKLAERIDKKQDLPNARFLEVTCGREGADFVVYVSWMTT